MICAMLHARGFSGGTMLKNLPANAGDLRDVDSILGSERFPGVGKANLFQYYFLENSRNRGA